MLFKYCIALHYDKHLVICCILFNVSNLRSVIQILLYLKRFHTDVFLTEIDALQLTLSSISYMLLLFRYTS